MDSLDQDKPNIVCLHFLSSPLGLDLGCTEVTVSTAQRVGVPKLLPAGPELAAAAAGEQLLAPAVTAAATLLLLSSAHSGVASWCRFWMGVCLFLTTRGLFLPFRYFLVHHKYF